MEKASFFFLDVVGLEMRSVFIVSQQQGFKGSPNDCRRNAISGRRKKRNASFRGHLKREKSAAKHGLSSFFMQLESGKGNRSSGQEINVRPIPSLPR